MKAKITENMFGLNQFSFSIYDKAGWEIVKLHGENYPSLTMDDGRMVVFIQEPNINERPWYDIQTKLYHEALVEGYEKFDFDFDLTISVEPNGYGSVFLAFIFEPENLDKVEKHIEDIWMAIDGENVCYKLGGYKYEMFIVDMMRIGEEMEGYDEDSEEARYVAEEYVAAVGRVGYTYGDRDDVFGEWVVVEDVCGKDFADEMYAKYYPKYVS